MAASTRLVLVLALALAACTPPGGTTPPTGGRKSPGPRTAPSVAPSGVVPSPAPGALVPKPGGGLVSDQAGQLATLEGVVRAPAGIIANNGGAIIANNGGGLITDNGAGLITDNGAGVIANNGGGYRLTQAVGEQKPFGGVLVEIQDAKGQPVLDAAGKPVRAVTGPDGRFRVTAPLPARNLVAVVKLEEGNGALQAIVGRGEGVRKADVELVSSLTTGYILGQYVAGQADPLATLERLPPAIEVATRAKAAAALADGRAAAPAALTAAQVQATIDALRAGDKAFDAQMEAVRKLLLAAGQSNLGDGLPATKVLLSSLHGVLPAPDGGIYLPSWTDRRLWRVLPDGTLRNVAGRGGEIDAKADGKPAREVGLGEIQAAGVDPQGRLVFADSDGTCRVWRVEADGTLKLLADLGSSLVFAMACAPDGTTWLVTARNGIMSEAEFLAALEAEEDDDSGFDLEAIAPDGTRTIAWRGVPVMDELNGVSSGDPMYVGPAGELLFLGQDEDEHVAALRVWPKERRVEAVPPPPGPAVALDRNGAWYYLAGGAVRIKEANGQDRVFLATPPAALDLEGVFAVPAPGGGTYFSDGALVYLVKDGVATLEAGLPASEAGVGGRETSLDPSGLAIRPDGTLLVAESTRGRVVTVAADGTVAAFIAPGGALKEPSVIRLDAVGALYATDGLAVKRIAKDGTATTLFTNPNARAYAFDLQVAADGTAYVAYSENPEYDLETEDGPPPATPARTLWRLAPGQAAERLEVITVGDPLAEADETFGMDAAGVLHLLRVADEGEKAALLAWRDGGWKPMGAPLQGTDTRDFISSFVLDAAGRIYVGFQDSAVIRYDVATGIGTTIAGKGGRIFLGTGVDDDAGTPFELQFDPKGDLLFLDSDNRQVKRIPKAKLD